MARPITLDMPLRDPHQELIAHLEQAPAEHAEALIELLDLAEGLHKCGLLTVARGALAAGNRLMEDAIDAIDSPQVIAGFRNLIVLAKTIGSIDPRLLRSIARAGSETLAARREAEEPPGTLALLGEFRRKEVRRGLAFISRFLAALGAQLCFAEEQEKSEETHRTSTA